MFSMQANEVKAQLSEVLRKVELGEEIMKKFNMLLLNEPCRVQSYH